jgi:hypothetical protein
MSTSYERAVRDPRNAVIQAQRDDELLAARTKDELDKAYDEGQSDERHRWVPLANLLNAHFIAGAQGDGSVRLSMAAVLELSAALKRARGD